MTPRPDIVAIRDTATVADVRAQFREQEYSRFPVYKESLDNVAGFLFVKDLLTLTGGDDSKPIAGLLRPAAVVPETKRVPELLKQFQRQQTQIAIVVDEYGGTAGLVTIEDVLEEIVGEIRDEYDREERGPVDRLPDGSMVIQGSALLKDLKADFDLPFEESPDYHTLAGFLLAKLKRIPRGGEWVEESGYKLTIVDMEGRRIVKIKLEQTNPQKQL
jgi:putative hemolysin